MATFPVTSSTQIQADAYNDIYNIVNEVISVGEDGYGLQDFFTIPVTTGTVNRARHWENMRIDLVETAYKHIVGTDTGVLSLPASAAGIAGGALTSAELPTPYSGPAGTKFIVMDTKNIWTYDGSAWVDGGRSSAITTATFNEAKVLADYVLANRFTCDESNYYRDPVTGISTNTTGGTSTRTIEWGVTENYIEHRVKVRWPTRLLARYFFNCGGYFNWTPYHANNGLNDIDAEWAAFIYNIQVAQGANTTTNGSLIYDRAKFVAQTPGTTATIYPTGSTRSFPQPTYEQGTLSINVQVYKALNEESIEFKIRFQNTDVGTLVVTPSVGYWNFIV